MNHIMTLEELLAKEEDRTLLDIYNELDKCVIPATGYAHEYCRKVNRMIDRGTLCINPTSYRKVYVPTLAKLIFKELSQRYVNYCRNMKGERIYGYNAEEAPVYDADNI